MPRKVPQIVNILFWPTRVVIFTLIFFALVSEAVVLPAASPAEVKEFRNGSAAHRLRLGTAVFKLLSDKKFIAANSEYAILAADIGTAVTTTLNHDYEKNNLRRDHPVVQTLAQANSHGLDYRSLPEHDPQRRNLMRRRDQLNDRDNSHWNSAISRRYKNGKAGVLLSNLVEALDYHDVAQARAHEFGANNGTIKRAFIPSSRWIVEKQHELGLKPEQLKRMVAVAQYAEDHLNYKEVVASCDPKRVAKHGFGRLAQGLIAQAKYVDVQNLIPPSPVAATVRPAPPAPALAAEPAPPTAARAAAVTSATEQSAASVTKSMGARAFAAVRSLGLQTSRLGALWVGAEYFGAAKDSAESVLQGVTTTGSVSDCQTVGCNEFRNLCKQLGKKEADCVDQEFFAKLSLHEQELRRRDPDLNQILQRYSPRVMDLRCQAGSSPSYLVTVAGSDRKWISYKIETDQDTQISRVQIHPEQARQHQLPTLMHVNGGQPRTLQYSTPENKDARDQRETYKTLQPNEWRNKKLYTHSYVFSSEASAAIARAQEASRLLSRNRAQMMSCCQNESCLNYFISDKLKRRPQPTKPAAATAGLAR
ncbi:MAG: hypothetical protein AB7K41_12415 [Bdellovibrionales bacterium]